MAYVSIFFNFMGNAEEAFNHYKKVFKTEFSAPIMRMGEIPPAAGMPAFSDADKKKVMHVALPILGGTYKMSFINFSTGNGHSFGGKFLEIKPNEFLQYTDTCDNLNLSREMITSVWFKKVSCGTELKVTQEGIPAVIPTEMCYLGWPESLDKLKKLVEPEIPEA